MHEPEIYGRDVALEVEKRIPEVFVAVKYPRPRVAYSKLLKKHGSDWVIDIHDAQRNYPVPTDHDSIASILYSRNYRDPNTLLYRVLNPFEEEWKRIPSRRQLDIPGGTFQPKSNPRLIRVELFPYITKDDSIEVVEELSKFLQKKSV